MDTGRRGLLAVVAGAVLPALAGLACGSGAPDASTPASFDHFVATGSYQGEYWPTADWRTCRPEDVGMDSASLYAAYEYAARSSFVTEGILVVRRGYVVGEEYLRGYGPTTRFSSFSVAKSFLSAVVGVAIDKGHVAAQARVGRAPHLAHAPRAERRHDLERAQAAAARQHHRRGFPESSCAILACRAGARPQPRRGAEVRY